MALTSLQIAHLNNMNRAAKDVSLGTLVNGFVVNAIVPVTTAVTAAQASASAVVLAPGLAAITGFIAQVSTSGSGAPIYSISSGSKITITSASASYKMATGDLVKVIAW